LDLAALSLMPLRLRNFSQLSLTQHLRCNGDVWTIKIPASEMKMGRPFTMPVPAILQRHLQYYFDRVRPALLAGLVSDRFWISFHHTAMDDHSVNGVITNFTRQVLGESINPHRFRHIGATSVVVAAPEMLEAARALLGHDNIQTTSDTYIIGSSLAACRQHGQLVSMLRDRMPEMRGACE
jgi:integrase